MSEYRLGFGHPKKEVWLGLNNIHLLTNSSPFELLITLEDFEAEEVEIRVNDFYLESETSNYKLFYSTFSGSFGQGLPSPGTPFTTESFWGCSTPYTGTFGVIHKPSGPLRG